MLLTIILIKSSMMIYSSVWNDTMYVCLCRVVTDQQIDQAVQNDGARCMRDLGDQLGVAAQCGQCGPMAKEILTESLSRLTESV